MKAVDVRKQIQTLLGGLTVDGIVGPATERVWLQLKSTPAGSEWPPEPLTGTGPVHAVMASSFADPADVAAFRRCKAQGKTDQQCFRVGDNGIGKWGDDTTVSLPMCALPPEDWLLVKSPRGKKVIVVCEGKQVICELRDTMPRKANIENGAGIDLNEAAWKVLGHNPPQMRRATWQWA